LSCTGNSHPGISNGSVGTGSGGAAMAGVTDRAVAASPSTAVLKERFTIIPQVAQLCCPRQVQYPSSAAPNRDKSSSVAERRILSSRTAVQVVAPERPGRGTTATMDKSNFKL
jgi:hypothetical protein